MTRLRRKVGRPSDYNEQIAAKLCRAIATSSDGLRVICAKNPMFPSRATILRWIHEKPDFRSLYARAKQTQTEAIFDEILQIADRVRPGTTTKVNARGKTERRVSDMVDRARLQVDARKWCLSKLLPKRFGDQPTDDGGHDNIQELIDSMRAASRRAGRPEGMQPKPDSDSEELVQ
jgi:terminase small subunit-like protein